MGSCFFRQPELVNDMPIIAVDMEFAPIIAIEENGFVFFGIINEKHEKNIDMINNFR